MIYRDHTRRLVLDHAYIVGVPLSQHARFLGRCSKATILFIFSVLLVLPAGSADDPGTLLKHNFESAKSALAAGNEIEAERHYNRTVALGLRQLANLSISESRFDEATGELDQALKSAPGDPDIGVDAAVAWFRAGEIQKARQLAQSVVAANPRHARAQNVLGRIDLYRGDFDAAIRDLQTSVAIDEDFETSYFLGVAYLQAKRFPDAQQWFKHLQDTMGDSAPLHVLRGRAYSISHFPEPAVGEFRKAIQLDPKYPHAHGLLRSSILAFLGEEAYPQARLEFERELKLHPDDYNALQKQIFAMMLSIFSTSPQLLLTAIATLPTASPACSNREPRTRKNPRKRWRREACRRIPRPSLLRRLGQ